MTFRTFQSQGSEIRSILFEYDNLGRRTKLIYPNGITTTYSYDVNSQLISLTNKRQDGTIISSYSYQYDKVGNRTSMTDLSGTHNYQYDEIYRLTSATHPTAENVPESFSYDSVGNRTTSHISTTYSYNSANQLLSDDKFIYSYDGNGNLFEKKEKATNKITRYIYNAEDQLIQIILPDGKVVKYGYDALGRRIWKEVAGVVTKYIYDNEDILFEYDKNNYIIARYTHGAGIDEPLVMDRNNKSYFYYFDGLGSVSEIVDSTGNIVNSYVYDSFGNIVEKSETVKNYYTYTSREYDSESGLYYYRARYYDAKVGRFLQKERYSCLILLDPQKSHRYSYVINNPINYSDPFGILPESVVKEYKDEAKDAIEKQFPKTFNDKEKERMAEEMLREATWKEAAKLKTGDDETKGEIIEDIHERVKERIEKEGTEEDKKLLKKVEKALKDKKEKEKCPKEPKKK